MLESVADIGCGGTLSTMDAVILSVGTELVTGECLDTNSAWISTRLTSYGVRVVRHVTIGDELDRLATSIRHALKASDLVIITGGLGPTEDDLSRHALASALDIDLEENVKALKQITDFFEQREWRMSESNLRQALIPKGCEVILNPRGTAPGILYESEAAGVSGGKMLVALPGVPAEMKVMFEAVVEPRLRETGRATASDRVQCFGIDESKLGEILADMMRRDRNPLVGTTASGAIISVRVMATGRSRDEANRLLDADLTELERRIGDRVFARGDGSLQATVAGLLTKSGRTIATAESCTGGLLAKRLTDVAGSSEYFLRGFVTYSNESKVEELAVPCELIAEHGAVSEPVARAMAEGCRARAKSDYGVGITGIAGPGGGDPPDKPVGLVYVALSQAGGCEVRRFLTGEHLTREEVRDRTAKRALNFLRLDLLKSLGS
jgi:competence/damage-inducible protein CinA-like protein